MKNKYTKMYLKYIYLMVSTTRIPEILGFFLHLNKMKTKRLSNHMSQNFTLFANCKGFANLIIYSA